MCNVVTTLDRLRRRRKPIARTVVLLVSWVWLSASASPCLGMMGEATVEAEHGETHHADGAPVSNHHDRSPPEHGGHCPHCPPVPTAPGEEPASSHITCSAADDLTNDNGRSNGQKWKIKYASLAPIIVASKPVAVLPSGLVSRADIGSLKPPLSLNLRYCVFLN